MTRILSTAALVVALTAGSASAWPIVGTGPSAFIKDAMPPGLKVGSVGPEAAGALKIFGASFAAWTVYRFFQNCGPFRCS